MNRTWKSVPRKRLV